MIRSATMAAAVLLLAGSVSPSIARQQDGTATRQAAFIEAESDDVTLIAKARAWSIDDTQAYLHAADAIGEIAAVVADKRPEAFVGSVLASDPRGAPTLLVKGPADEFVSNLASSADIPIVVVDNQPYSFDELESRKQRVRQALADMGYESVSALVNIAGKGVVKATAAITDGAPGTRDDAAALLPDDLRASVDLELVPPPKGRSDLTSFGGMRIYPTLDPDANCTGGWTVQRSSDGLFGLATAGHCEAPNREIHPGDATHTLVVAAGTHMGQWGDVEWHPTSVGDLDDFYSNGSTIRDVQGVEPRASISVGEAVCFYGRTSNVRDCSLSVIDVSAACTSDDGHALDRIVLMDGAGVADFGDSGGGFSVNYTAYGIMHGGCNPYHPYNGGLGWVSFSVADLFDEALGVSVYR